MIEKKVQSSDAAGEWSDVLHGHGGLSGIDAVVTAARAAVLVARTSPVEKRFNGSDARWH